MTQLSAAPLEAALAAHQDRGRLRNRVDLVPGVCASWDDKHGKVTLQYDTTNSCLLHLEGQTEGAPRWLTLQFDLGTGSVEPGSIIGLAATVRGSAPHDLAPFIRTEHKGKRLDARLSGPMPATSTEETHTIVDDKVMSKAQFRFNTRHRLLMRLPLGQFGLTFSNLHLFLHPAPEKADA